MPETEWMETGAEQLGFRVFRTFEEEWAVLTARRADGGQNSMTVSWGGLGVLWGRQVAFYFVRPQRYTMAFLDAGGTASLSFFFGRHREALRYLGRHSGRTEDKTARCGLSPCALPDGAPTFREAGAAFSLYNLYADFIRPAGFLVPAPAAFYETEDYHRLFVAEIRGVYRNREWDGEKAGIK